MAKKSAHRLARDLARRTGQPDPGPLKPGMYRELVALAPIKLADAIDDVWNLVKPQYDAKQETYSNYLLDLMAVGMIEVAKTQRQAEEKKRQQEYQQQQGLIELADEADLNRYVGRR